MAADAACRECLACPHGIIARGHSDCFRYYLFERGYVLTAPDWEALRNLPDDDLLAVALQAPKQCAAGIISELLGAAGEKMMALIRSGRAQPHPSVVKFVSRRGRADVLELLLDAGVPIYGGDTLCAALAFPDVIRLLAEERWRSRRIVPNDNLWYTVAYTLPFVSDDSILALYDGWPDETRANLPSSILDGALERRDIASYANVKPARRG